MLLNIIVVFAVLALALADSSKKTFKNHESRDFMKKLVADARTKMKATRAASSTIKTASAVAPLAKKAGGDKKAGGTKKSSNKFINFSMYYSEGPLDLQQCGNNNLEYIQSIKLDYCFTDGEGSYMLKTPENYDNGRYNTVTLAVYAESTTCSTTDNFYYFEAGLTFPADCGVFFFGAPWTMGSSVTNGPLSTPLGWASDTIYPTQSACGAQGNDSIGKIIYVPNDNYCFNPADVYFTCSGTTYEVRNCDTDGVISTRTPQQYTNECDDVITTDKYGFLMFDSNDNVNYRVAHGCGVSNPTPQKTVKAGKK